MRDGAGCFEGGARRGRAVEPFIASSSSSSSSLALFVLLVFFFFCGGGSVVCLHRVGVEAGFFFFGDAQFGEDGGREGGHAAEDFGEDAHEGAEGGFGDFGAGEAGVLVGGEKRCCEVGRVDEGEGGEVAEVGAEAHCCGALEEGGCEGGVYCGFLFGFLLGDGEVWLCRVVVLGDGGGGRSERDGFGFDEVRQFEDYGREVDVREVGGVRG